MATTMTIEALGARVEELERQLATTLAAEVVEATEIRTRRLVVVDSEGAERIIASADPHASEHDVELRILSPDGQAHLTLYADANGSHSAGWYLSLEGNTTAHAAAGPHLIGGPAYIDVDGTIREQR